VVKANRTVEQRTIVSDRSVENEAIVSKGLQVGEIVVLDGQVNLVPGTKVELKNDLNSSATPDRGDRSAVPSLSAMDRSTDGNPGTKAR